MRYRVQPYLPGTYPGFVFRATFTATRNGRDYYRVEVRHARKVIFAATDYSPSPFCNLTPRYMAREVWDFAQYYADNNGEGLDRWDTIDVATIQKHADAVSCALGEDHA